MNEPALKSKPANDLSPASAAKRNAILAAAARVFMGSGYGAASMDQIAVDAGVSKQTIYSHFGAKDTLFEEIVKNKCSQLMEGDALPSIVGRPIQELLHDVAVQFQRVVLTDESMTLFRAIISESARFPELASAFYRSGPRAASDRLSVVLEQAAANGELLLTDPTDAAERFFALLRDDLYMVRVLGLAPAPLEADIEIRARRAANNFMRMYGA